MDYFPIWKIITEGHVSISDIEAEWTMERIASYMAYLEMVGDYKNAWTEFYQRKTNNG